MQKIYYIGFYSDKIGNDEGRYNSPAAVDKMNYIAASLVRAGFGVEILSPSWSIKKGWKYLPGRINNEIPNLTVRFTPSMVSSFKLIKLLNIFLSLLWVFLWLILKVKRNEKILVYHSPLFSLPIIWAKKLKGFKLILEVEEIYGEVFNKKDLLGKWEKKLIECADNYIAVSDVLAEILGERAKIIIYGNYSVPQSSIKEVNHHHSSIHVVYAGLVDKVKGGAYNTMQCVKYLPKEYIIHICGYGGEEEVKELERQVIDLNERLGRQACIYHGLIPENEFSDFLHKCHIAINPQFDGENMTTLFPSKIIKYLSHNLRVVSTSIKSIRKSKIASLITFSDNDSPESNAKAIMQVDPNAPYDSCGTIRILDKKFVEEMKDLISN